MSGSTHTSVQQYHRESQRPLVCLAFVAPILLTYEFGLISLGTQTSRNGIDVLLRNGLSQIGFENYFLLPLLTAIILLAWHHLSGQHWQISKRTLWVMFVESSVLALALLLVANVQYDLFAHHLKVDETTVNVSEPVLSLGDNIKQRVVKNELGKMIGYFGAGVYEELLFRLIMLPVSIAILAWLRVPEKMGIIVAVAGVSLLFASAHYEPLNPAGYAFDINDASFLFTFAFRTFASVIFCCLFLYRGFGIAVGVHAIYDLLTHIL